MIENNLVNNSNKSFSQDIEKLFKITDYIHDILVNLGLSETLASMLDDVIGILILLIISYISGLIAKKVIHNIVERLAKFTPTNWDDIFIENKVIYHLVKIFPAIVFIIATPFAITSNIWVAIFQKAAQIFIVISILRAIQASSVAMTIIYSQSKNYSNKPLKVVFQIVTVIAYFIGFIIIISILINRDFTSLFAALGASMAILLLVFKDSILGFVAGWQLTANDMLRIGDWITVSKYGADGDVIEISLYSVKVKNFDNTITTIPPYSLVSESFQNWRGMQESGGRRVKRSILIDMTSIRFCDDQLIAELKKIDYIKEYIQNKEIEIQAYNKANNIDNSVIVNGRRQTNLGIFRAYLNEYLKKHPEVNQSMICMVRQLQPTEKGIPMELYFFIANKNWVYYENVQSDIFDHVLSAIPHFKLKVYQFPSISTILT